MCRTLIVTLIVAGFLLPICGHYNQGVSAAKQREDLFVPLCQILQQPWKYDSKEVVTYGVAGNSFHQVDFFDPECSLPKHGGGLRLRFAESHKLGQPQDKKYLKLLRKEGALRANLRGFFVGTGGPFGPEGSPFEFRIVEILDTQKLSTEYRKKYSLGTGQTNPDK